MDFTDYLPPDLNAAQSAFELARDTEYSSATAVLFTLREGGQPSPELVARWSQEHDATLAARDAWVTALLGGVA